VNTEGSFSETANPEFQPNSAKCLAVAVVTTRHVWRNG
jgi:hypothetical protein